MVRSLMLDFREWEQLLLGRPSASSILVSARWLQN